MWISEGFIHGSSDEQEEVGEEYFQELILRNLIAPVHKFVDNSSCTMHDIVRSFAHYVSKDEALVVEKGHIDFGDLDLVKACRLTIQIKGSASPKLDWKVIQKQKSLRTLMLDGNIMFKSHDSLSSFSRLRTLVIDGGKIDALADSLCHLKHLRYLGLVHTDISRLPRGIGQMKFLQYISLVKCEETIQIPSSIIKLGQLRCIAFIDTKISGIPRGFGGLLNLNTVVGFPAHMDTNGALPKEDWCSLEELGSISQLRWLEIQDLENVSASSFARKAKLADKEHLTTLKLECTSRVGDIGLVKGITEEEKQRIENVFDELCPPPCLDKLSINGYFGRQLPTWMLSPSSTTPLKSLRFLFLVDLACFTQLPNSLCQIPFLEFIKITGAPAIKHIGPAFVQAQQYHHAAGGLVTFPRLQKLQLCEMSEWAEWEWEAQTDAQAMPLLEELLIKGCKLRCVPPGLTFHAISLKKLQVVKVQHLKSLDSFTSVTELKVWDSCDLERIADLPMLQKLSIFRCPKMKVLEGVPALISLILMDYDIDTLPEYIQEVNPRRLELCCSLSFLTSLTLMNA